MKSEMLNLSNVIVLLLVASTATAQSSEGGKRSQLSCEETAACMCFDYNEIEIQCPKLDPHVFVRIQPNNYVHFECENLTKDEYNLVPKYDLEVADFLQITRCTLLDGSVMDTYLKNIKINRIRALQFVSSGANRNTELQTKHFQGLTNLERFDLRGAEGEIEKLPEDLFKDMKTLTWVRIRVAKIVLPDELFAPLENLEFLELGHNKLETLPAGFLKNQQKLSQLNLWGNSLRNLKKESFIGLNCVKELDLSANGIVSFESDLLSPLVNLTDINLTGNNLESLPEGFFANNKKLKFVKLMENRVQLKTLPSGLFANLTDLNELFLKAELEILPENLFEGSINIVRLKLDRNKLNNLPQYLLRDQKKLTNLQLQENLIDDLPESFFVGPSSLSELDLSGNQLTVIRNKVFKPLTQLIKLNLNNNQITTIESKSFVGNSMLEYLTMENNKIALDNETIASPFQTLDKLETLNLRNNSITQMFDDFTLISLNFLDLSYNKIEWVSTNDLNNIKTKKIDLSNNLIKVLDFRMKINENIEVVVNENPIECDCKVHSFVKHLVNNTKPHVQISELRCATILVNKSVTDLDPLELLCPIDSEETEIKKCPEGFECDWRPEDHCLLMKSNLSADFRLNHFNLPFIGQKKMEFKIVDSNLTELPQALLQNKTVYDTITNLTLYNNQLTEIPIEYLPKMLTYFDVSYNQLETLNETVLSSLKSKNLTIKLGGNPWRCDCNNKGFVKFVQDMIIDKKVEDRNEIFCDGSNKPVRETDVSKLCSEDENMFIIVLCIITAIMGILIGALAALYYKYQKQIKMWLYSHSLLLWFVTEEELDKEKRYDAFVSYSHCDNDFVADYLLPELENGTIPYKLCVHERDWIPGLEISTQISNSVNDSRRIIIVMSPNYLQSNWAKWEFQVAQSHAATEKRSRIIVILKEDIGDINKLDADIRDYLNLNTYVKWGDKWFWEKLKYAMPHVKSSERLEKGKGLVKTAMKSSVDDKLELIKPISVTPPMLTTPPAEKVANPLIASLNAKNAANQNGKAHNGYNGHINGAYVINTSSRQSDV